MALCVICGCVRSMPDQSTEMVALNAGFRLNSTELRAARRAAQLGDINAAKKLYKHYTFAGDDADPRKSAVWLRWLAHRGVTFAQFNYGVEIIEAARTRRQVQNGWNWMLKAKEGGHIGGEDMMAFYKDKYNLSME